MSNCKVHKDVHPADLLGGVFMPVRFIAWRLAGESRAYVAFLSPVAFARLFDSPALARVAAELEGDMRDVLEEVDF